jgi:hypothetical protein
MKTVFRIGLVFVIWAAFEMNSVAAEMNEPAQIFKPALDRILGKTQIPILLPWNLPWLRDQKAIKIVSGRIEKDGYFISLYYDGEIGVNANYAAGFGASTEIFRGLGTPVQLENGRTAEFRPVSCGGSCAPANLWWEQNGVVYQIQIKLPSDTPEEEQKKILIETANCSVEVR